jgi:hypothetical protein
MVCCALQNSKTCKQMKHLQNIYQALGPLIFVNMKLHTMVVLWC